MTVRALAPAAVLVVWVRGAARHPVDRALVLLSAAFPGASRAELAALPVGERDAALLRLRRATVGAELSAFTECAACGARYREIAGVLRQIDPPRPRV